MPDVTRIIEQKATESIYNDDWALIDRPTEGEDGGTRKILVSRLKELLCGDYIADEWVAGETYTNGAIVSHEGKLYYNNSGGALVQTTFNPNAWLEVKIDELLEKVISSVGQKWRLVDTYHYDDLVVYGGRLYRCIKNASTQGTWVSNEWIEANAEYYFKKVREYIARYGFVPSREAVSSPYNKGDLILYRAPGDTTNSLYMRLNDTENGDPTWIPENWLKVENIGEALSKIYKDMEESICDVQIKEQSIVDENKVADLTSLAMVGSASGAIATFDDGSDLPMPKLEVAIEPQQDLHGYDAPWVGGAGKNKLEVTATTTTKSGVTFTVKEDGTIVVTGTKSSSSDVRIWFDIAVNISFSNDVILNGCPSDGSTETYKMAGFVGGTGTGDYNDVGNGVTIPANTMLKTLSIGIAQQGNISLVFKPMIRLATETDATFAPYSNICPISGWDEVNVGVSGVNVWDEEWEVGGLNPLNGDATSENDRIRSKNFRPCKPNMTMFYYIPSGKGNLQIVFYDINKNYLGYYNFTTEHTFTTPNGCYFFKFNTGGSYGTTYNNDISINYPSTDTSYHAYNGQTYTIQFKDGDNPLTVYGGTLDVVSGVLTVDRAYVDLGTLAWGLRDSGTVVAPYFFSNIENLGVKYEGNFQTVVYSILCSMYKIVKRDVSAFVDGTICVDGTMGERKVTQIQIKDARYSDATAFKTAMNGVQLVYELATPQTIQLTPTQVKSLLGVNNIWADTGDVLDAEYIRNATTIINSLIARIEALENQ